ncbi:MAG: hypothetical protein IH587_11265, partial [Anaerolineae bacterium]|nr:hypothetical protein [Anaerolineae bacterium]
MSSAQSTPAAPIKRRKWLTDNTLTSLSLILSFVLLCAFFASQTPYFLSQANLSNIASTIAIVGITSIGMT